MITFRFQLRRHFISAVLVLPFFTLTVPIRAAIDDFNDGDDTNGVVWVHYDPIARGMWSFPNGAYRIQSAASLSPTTQGPGRAGSFVSNQVFSTFYVAADIVTWDNTLDEVFGLSARANNLGFLSTTGYAFVYGNRNGPTSNGQIGLIGISGEVNLTLLATANIALLPNQGYRFVFFGAPGQLTGQVFAKTNLFVPLVTISASDSTYASGSVGLFGYADTSSGRVDFTIDNYEFKELPPPLTIGTDPQRPDEVVLSWPSWAASFRLERTNFLPAEGATQ